MLQYHLSPNSKVRPYFGAGLNTRLLSYKLEGTFNDAIGSASYSDKMKTTQFYPMMSQGVTWQINSKWQFNESASYMFNHNSTVVGLKLGFAYIIK